MFFENQNSVAREEIFAPVVIAYDTPDEAVHIANDTPYWLGAYIAGDSVLAKQIVGKIRARTVFVNSGRLDFSVPFGG